MLYLNSEAKLGKISELSKIIADALTNWANLTIYRFFKNKAFNALLQEQCNALSRKRCKIKKNFVTIQIWMEYFEIKLLKFASCV